MQGLRNPRRNRKTSIDGLRLNDCWLLLTWVSKIPGLEFRLVDWQALGYLFFPQAIQANSRTLF